MPDFRLYRGSELIGTLTRTDDDMPWHNGTFKPAAGFRVVRPFFDRERELLDADRMDEWQTAWDEIEALGLRLEPVAGGADITEFVLHIDGSKAWWRY
jgi:hypothetical protein